MIRTEETSVTVVQNADGVFERSATHVHYHDGDAISAFPGVVCAQCPREDRETFAADFLAKTAAQSASFLTPAPADYLACDRTLNEERERLRWEFLALPKATLIQKLADDGRRITEHLWALGIDDLVEELVDTVCPRAWLDRRLKEVL